MKRLAMRSFVFLSLLLGTSLCAQTLDAYGGRIAISCTATGWFHTQKIGNRWWLCTPAGHGFYAQMVNSVSPNEDSTLVTKVSSKYGGPIQWTTPADQELQSWNFNTLTTNAYFYALPIGTDPSFPLDSNGIHSQPTKMPFTLEVRPSHYSMLNPSLGGAPFLTNPVKNMVYAHSPFYPGFVPSSGIADYYDSGIATWLTTDLNASSAQDFVMNAFANSTYKNYIIGFMLDDGDEMFGFGAGPDFTTIPPGHNNTNVALLVATGSPLETANSAFGFAYTDTLIHSKVAFRNALATQYVTIGALNTAWGSSYTTFDSSGVCIGTQPITCASSVSADSVGTGDGATLTFSTTLSHSTISGFSLQILVAGTPVAGDTGSGTVFGPNLASGTINYTTKALSITFTGGHAPANGAAITATYVANGWGIGTGFLDEDNRVSHNSYLGTDWVGLSNANATAKVDLNTFYQTIAAKYFSDCNTQIHAVYPNVMNLGPDALSSWSVPSAAPVLKAAGLYTDAFVTASTSTIFPQAQLDFIATNYGDKPYIGSYYTDANPDSALSAFPGSGLFSTQAARASTYSTMQTAQLNAQTTAGNFPYIGTYWFKLYDGWNEHLNWGLKTHLDNAYDGHEPVTGTVACSSPLASFTCGGEPVPASGGGTPPFGNLVTSVTNANSLWIAPPPPNTITAASCSSTDVQTAINASSNGDTVLVPGGTCSWATNGVTIGTSHQITLSGQGITTINWTGSGTQASGTVLAVTAGTANNTIVTGFTFNGAFINGAAPITFNTTFSPLTQTFRFYGNILTYSGSTSGTMINITGNGGGLLDHNQFTAGGASASELVHILGEAPSNVTAWAEDVVPGGPINIFLEDNAFNYTSGGNTSISMTQLYYGGREVFRHNTVNMGAIDIHGTNLSTAACNNPPGPVNGRWLEAYNNNFHVTGPSPNSYGWFALRGGSGVIFNNTSDNGTGQGAGAINITSDCVITYSGGYPVPQQVGRGIGGTTHSSPMYLWNNVNTTTGVPMPIQNLQNQGANFSNNPWVQANRDYFTSGSQPATITRCESTADVVAGCPVSYAYTPYTYPHPLTGTATPQLSFSPNPASFGNQNINTTSAPITITISNIGAATQTYTSIALTANFANGNTGLAGQCPASGAILASASCTVKVTFTPTAVQAYNGSITMTGTVNGSGSLTGNGSSSVSIPATPTNFAVSSSGPNVTLTWTASLGTPPITYNCQTSPPPNGSGGPFATFVTTLTTSCPFVASGTGTYWFRVSATNSAGTSAPTSPLSVVVAPATPSANLAPSAMSFPSTGLGVAASTGCSSSATCTIVLTNNGTASLTITSISVAGSNAADFVATPTCGGSLAVSASCNIPVVFTPTAIGLETASVVLVSNDPTSPDSVALSGTGFQPLTVLPSSLSFGTQYLNKTSAAKTVTLTNNTASTLTFSSTPALTTGTQYTISANTCGTGGSTVAANASCTISITFTPTSTGSKTDTLTFAFTGPSGSPITVAISGTGKKHGILRVGGAVKWPYNGADIMKTILRPWKQEDDLLVKI